MAFRFFVKNSTARAIAGGSAICGAGLVGGQTYFKNSTYSTKAECEFEKSYGYCHNNKEIVKPPKDWEGPLFQIHNKYPTVVSKDLASPEHNSLGLPPIGGPDRPPPSADPLSDAPWLKVDFKAHPEEFCSVIQKYCWAGNTNNDFVLAKNQYRDWYHAPWMHWNVNGREPLHGLTFERPTEPFEFSKTQTRYLQNWACGFYNRSGATVFGKIWENPADPKWENVNFPLGTCVFKILMTDATDEEIPFLKDSPTLQAVIAEKPMDPQARPKALLRQDKASCVRLLQVDFAVRDDRAPIGWVFGTLMYDGNQKNQDRWDRVIPVGIMWGNDPELTPSKAAAGQKPKESWINCKATKLRESLGGTRPSWGFGGRLNGPVDDFKSACTSCHSIAEKKAKPKMFPDEDRSTDEAHIMKWYRNIPAGQPFTHGDISGDYSLQLMIGYNNFLGWSKPQEFMYRTKVAIPYSKWQKEAEIIEAKRAPLREAPPAH